MRKTMPSIGIALVGLSLGLCAGSGAARAQGPSTDVQHQAMQKLAFLEGHWSGPVTIVRGPGEPLKATQTEDVQFKLDGLVLLIEGNSIRSTERITGADRNTVMKLLVMAGEKCEKLMGRVIVNSSGQGCGVR